jgi:hypothetical protein
MLATFCLVILLVVSQHSAQATLKPLTLDLLLDEFGEGTFLRSSLVQVGDGELGIDEEIDGGVQLALSGSLRRFKDANFTLPDRLSEVGTATIGNRIYLFGGLAPEGDPPSNRVQSEVWSAAINLNEFEVVNEQNIPSGRNLLPCEPDENCVDRWRLEGDLPSVAGNWPGTTPISKTSGLAVTAVDNPTGNDYIYVLGGYGGQNNVSQYTTRIAVVNEQGEITEWKTSAQHEELEIPGSVIGDDSDQDGVRFASAANITIDETTYVYLLGGQVRWQPFGSLTIEEEGSNRVYYAEVCQDGLLCVPGTSDLGWAITDPLPVPISSSQGLWRSAAVAASFADFSPTLLVIGGQTKGGSSPDYTSAVHRGTIDEADGSVTWGGWTGTMSAQRFGHGAVENRGSVYVTGGAINGSTLSPDALSSYVEEGSPTGSLQLHDMVEDDPDTVQNHFNDPDPDAGGNDYPPLRTARAFHGSAVVYDGYETIFLYVLGGLDQDGTDAPENTDSVYMLRISRLTFYNPVYVSSGRYTSRPHEIPLANSRVQQITWRADIPRDSDDGALMDIEMEYRTSTEPCDRPDWTSFDWEPIDGAPGEPYFSRNTPEGDQNVYVLFDPSESEGEGDFIQCFQYRAQFKTNHRSQGDNLSPTLTEVGIRIYTEDSPDLFVSTLEPEWRGGREGFLDGLQVAITNEYTEDRDRTLPADVETRTDRVNVGTEQNPQWMDINYNFFNVDMYVFGRGFPYQDVITPTLPLTDTGYITTGVHLTPTLVAGFQDNYPGLSKHPWTPWATVGVDSWCLPPEPPDYDQRCTEDRMVDIPDLFEDKETGNYTICIAVDSYVAQYDLAQWGDGYVTESLPGAEDNNYTCREMFIVSAPKVSMVPLDGSQGTLEVEEGQSLSFAVQLSKLSSVPLNIGFTVSGAATYGATMDYVLEDSNGQVMTVTGGEGQITVPANTISTTLTLRALTDDDQTENRLELADIDLQDDMSAIPLYELSLSSPERGANVWIVDPFRPKRILMPLMMN